MLYQNQVSPRDNCALPPHLRAQVVATSKDELFIDAEAINPALVGTVFAVFGVFSRLSSVLAGLVVPQGSARRLLPRPAWRVWFICCIVMMLAFIPLCMYGLGGYYSPRKAKGAFLQR